MNAPELEKFINDYLKTSEFRDYCPNGIQVEGRTEVRKIVTGVSATQKLIDYAVSVNADAVLVHHGIFWKGDPQALRSFRKKKCKRFI